MRAVPRCPTAYCGSGCGPGALGHCHAPPPKPAGQAKGRAWAGAPARDALVVPTHHPAAMNRPSGRRDEAAADFRRAADAAESHSPRFPLTSASRRLLESREFTAALQAGLESPRCLRRSLSTRSTPQPHVHDLVVDAFADQGRQRHQTTAESDRPRPGRVRRGRGSGTGDTETRPPARPTDPRAQAASVRAKSPRRCPHPGPAVRCPACGHAFVTVDEPAWSHHPTPLGPNRAGSSPAALTTWVHASTVDSTRALILRSMSGWKTRSATSKSGHQSRWIPNGSL